MDKSGRLRLREVRAAFRLIGECRDLGADPQRWYRHMAEGLCRLIGARAGIGGEGLWPRPPQLTRPITWIETGFTPKQQVLLKNYFRVNGPGHHPIASPLQGLNYRLVTRSRRQLLDDQAWYRSQAYADFHASTDTDHCLVSLNRHGPDHLADYITLHRAVGERDFSSRERRLLHLFHGELGRLIGSVLMSAAQSPFDRLSLRQRQTLACLLEGDSEKQVARRLGLSLPTVHQYVTALYRRFQVNSRSELLAYFLRWRAHIGGPAAGEPN